jgi:hypothetical protein
MYSPAQGIRTSCRPNHTVPYGTELVFREYQALRTWLRSFSPFGTKTLKSLRNNKPSHLSTFSTPHRPKSSSTSTSTIDREPREPARDGPTNIGMTKPTSSVYWGGVSADPTGTDIYNLILIRYFCRRDRETLSRCRNPGSATLRNQ